jgi:acid phosphatase
LLTGFIAFGDFGGGDGQVAVAAAMSTWATSHRVDALVTTGDNVYESGEPAKYPAQLDAPYASLRSTRPLWATLGNHDAQHGAEELRYLKLPSLPYIRELPGVQLLFLDANRPDAAQATWLDQQLAAAGPRVRVVVFHQPAYSCGVHGSTAAVDQQWVPVFEKHHVALVLNGHDHDYERFTGPAEVNYVVTGGGGQAVYPTLPLCAPRGLARRASATRHHFTFVEVHEHSFTIQAVATDGTVFDRVTVTR